MASSLDINDCVLSYFEGTANLHCYTSCTLTTLHCSKVSFLQCCHMKRYNKIFTKMWGVYSLLWGSQNSRFGSIRHSGVSRLGTFSIRGRGDWLCSNVGNISVLNHEGEPMDITQAGVCTRVCTLQTLCKIYAGERLNLSQFSISRKWK